MTLPAKFDQKYLAYMHVFYYFSTSAPINNSWFAHHDKKEAEDEETVS